MPRTAFATQAELVAETDAAANAMIAAATPPKKDAGIVERLLTSAESLVSVRPIGAVEGDGVPEIVARMEVAIQAGDLEKALAEYDTLAGAGQGRRCGFRRQDQGAHAGRDNSPIRPLPAR